MELPPIIMYARQTFCPDVARSRMRRTDPGLVWTGIDVEDNFERQQEMTQYSGELNVPTLVIGDLVLVDPSNDMLDKALDAAGYTLDGDR